MGLTIKCLLIVPNPKSALNEEAGKLLLERYDDYCARAKLYTDIHAKSNLQVQSSKPTSSSGSASMDSLDEASANKKACNVSLKKKSDKVAKDKKKTLKRL